MLSVMVPVKACLGGAAAREAAARATQSETASGYFMISLSLRANTVCQSVSGFCLRRLTKNPPVCLSHREILRRFVRKKTASSVSSSDRPLLAGGHEVRGGRAGIHDPDAVSTGFLGQPGCRRRSAGDGDGHVHARMFLVGAHEVVPHRPVLRLQASAVLFRVLERLLGLVAHGFE